MTIGETLAAARVRAGLSVDDVSAATRMRATVVRAIEADDFRLCGGDFYARGHIRNLAHVVGIDPAPLLAEFDARFATSEDGPSATTVFEAETSTAKPERRGPNWSGAMAAALVVVVALAVFQLARGDTNKHPAVDTAHQTTATTTPTPTDDRDGDAPGQRAVAQPAADQRGGDDRRQRGRQGHQGPVLGHRRGADGTTLFSDNVAGGQEKTFTDPQQVKLVLGNAGAVDLEVNGVNLGAPGGDGQVTRLTFGPGDPTLAQG